MPLTSSPSTTTRVNCASHLGKRKARSVVEAHRQPSEDDSTLVTLTLALQEPFGIVGKVVVIAGCGRATELLAETFVVHGIKVYVASAEASIAPIATALTAAGPGSCIAIRADLATASGRTALATRISESEEAVNLLINTPACAAAESTASGPAEEQSSRKKRKANQTSVQPLLRESPALQKKQRDQSDMSNEGADEDRDARRHAFAVLQDKYVSARRLACCPTMDLVAVLTVDGQLVVHRTISWQRLLHVKPSEVGFEITVIEWSPDGLLLALGCDEGEVVVYEIESGEQRPELRALKHLRDFQHSHAITAMHWVACSPHHREPQQQANQSYIQSLSRSYFGYRAKRFLEPQSPKQRETASKCENDTSVLVTADASGAIVLWWMGKIYLTKVDVKALLQDQGGDGDSGLTIALDSVRLAPDLSQLVVVITMQSGDSSNALEQQKAPATTANNRKHQLVTLDLSSVRHVADEISFVARMVDESHEILNQLVLSMRQMATEWKNATRIFELKMGLIGSLYEKYACEDPPQVDMLSVVASGITSPALAQYFAQDIQEMSVDRMQKLLMSGCQTLANLIEGKMKAGLVKLLFHLSELRGRAKWKRTAFADTMGVAITTIDDLVTITQDALIGMEIFSHAVHETRQDFGLFLQWVLERIRIHTNASATTRTAASDWQGGGDATKSLLNQRRLCNFLQRAAEEAQAFRELQPLTSKYRVEVTFGNLVSKQLAKPRVVPMTDASEGEAANILVLLENLETKWFAMIKELAQSVAGTVTIEPSDCFDFGSESVEEFSFHYRREGEALIYNTGGEDDPDDDDDDSDDDEEDEEMEAVDWSSLQSFALAQNRDATHSLLMFGIRLQTNQLVLLRAKWSRSPQDQLEVRGLVWAAVKLAPQSETQLRGFHFYGDKASGKKEQLAFLLTKSVFQDGSEQQQDWLYFQQYDQLVFHPLKLGAKDSLTAKLSELPESPLPMAGKYRARLLTTSSSTANALIPQVIANAKRGIVCVSTLANRLTILDAEDDEDEDEDDDDEEDDDVEEGGVVALQTGSEHHKGHESDSNEVDL